MDAFVSRLEYSAHHIVDRPAQLSERGAPVVQRHRDPLTHGGDRPRAAPPLRDEMGAARCASMTFDVVARGGPARSVTRVTYRRLIECPGPRPLAHSAQPAIKYCHRN